MKERLRQWARAAKRELVALWLASRDPRTPLVAKVVAACVVAYAFSPIDLIPDPIPVLGYLDDLILVPLGVVLARRLVPPDVMQECRERAAATGRPRSRAGAVVVVCTWLLLVAGAVWLIRR